MKKITLLLLLLVTSWQINAQVSINQGFDAAATPAGWTYVSFSRSTTTPCAGVASVRRNFWSSGLAGSVTTQNYAAGSNGAQIDVSFDWKSEEYSAGDGVGVNMDVQYSTDNGATWTTFGNVTTTAITTCATWSGSIPAGTVPNGSDFKLKFDGTHTGGDCYFYIDNITATQATSTPPNCTVLSTPANGATSISSSVVSWTAATGAPTGYRLNVGTAPGGTTVLNNFDVGNVLTYDLGTLLAGTTYYVTVIPYNANGPATGCTESSFATCGAYAVPYTEAFENAGVIPSCWTMTGSEIWRFSNTGAGNHIGNNGTITGTTPSGGYFAWVDDSSPDTTDATLTSPFIDASTLTNPRLTFYELSNNEGANPNSTLNVEVWDGAAWNNVGIFTGNTVGGWEKKIISLSSLTITGNIQVRFIMAESSSFYDDIAIDDVTIEQTPSCVNPVGLAASAITSTSATVTWTATTGNYEYVLDAVATDPAGAGTALPGETYNATPLTPSTVYYFHVRSVCAGPTYSTWSTVSFTTPCAPYTIPYFEGFETGYTHNTPVTGCLLQESTTGTEVWTANASLTDYNRTPRTGTYNAFLRYGNEDWIFIPIDLVGGTSYTASLFARQDDVTATDADMTISYGTAANAAGMTNPIVAATGIINGGYQQIIGSFTPATTGTYYVGIKGFMNGTPWYISLDDISIDVTPACANPLGLIASSITDTSATTTWTATTGNYEYVLDTNAADPAASGTTLVGATYNATLLNPSTVYYFHVRSVCAGPSYSTWSTVSFTTACAPVSAFTENFDGVVAPAFPNCWARVGTAGNANIQTTSPSSGINTMYLYGFSGSLGVVKTIPVSNLGAGTHRLNFKMRGNFTAGDDVEVGYLTDPADAATFIALGTVNAATLTYADYTVTPPAGVYSNYLAFRHTGTIGASVLIDDVVWEPIPACNNPSGLAVSGLTSTSATVTWTATTGNYEYVLDTNAADPAASGTTLAVETYNATSLTPSTVYYFHVRTVCAGPTYSTWATVSFTTPATPPANDDCLGATVLIPAGDFPSGAIVTTNVASTANAANGTPTTCFGFGTGQDIWFSAIIPASGTLTIETGNNASTITDTVITVYSGSCGALTQIACDDDSSADGAFSKVDLTSANGIASGDTVYVRAYEYGTNTYDTFKIAAYDASLSTRSFDATGFSAYPNPVKDVLNLSYTKEISSVSVHNLLGQEVMTKSINATQSKIDMSNLSNGTYLVKVTVDGLVKTLKVVKQ